MEINTNVLVFSHNFAFLEPLSVILNIYGVRINHKCEMFLSSSLVDGNKHPYILQSLSWAGVSNAINGYLSCTLQGKTTSALQYITVQYIDNFRHRQRQSHWIVNILLQYLADINTNTVNGYILTNTVGGYYSLILLVDITH